MKFIIICKEIFIMPISNYAVLLSIGGSKEKQMKHYILYDHFSHYLQREPSPRVHEINSYNRGFIVFMKIQPVSIIFQ